MGGKGLAELMELEVVDEETITHKQLSQANIVGNPEQDLDSVEEEFSNSGGGFACCSAPRVVRHVEASETRPSRRTPPAALMSFDDPAGESSEPRKELLAACMGCGVGCGR